MEKEKTTHAQYFTIICRRARFLGISKTLFYMLHLVNTSIYNTPNTRSVITY